MSDAVKGGEVTDDGLPAGQGSGDPAAGDGGQEEFIGGTPFKSADELAKGYLSLKNLHDTQGNELGNLRKSHDVLKTQTETLTQLLKENMGKGNGAEVSGKEAKAPVDYGAELAKIESQVQDLDPLSPTYQKDLSTLFAQSTRIASQMARDDALSAASDLFKQELSDRDIQVAQQSFYQSNPDFNTPEMQARIKERIASDKTGMTDALSAYRELQRDDALARVQGLESENAEYKRLIDLNKGKEEAGKVVVKPQNSTPPPPQQKTKLAGKDLDNGMIGVLKKLRGE